MVSGTVDSMWARQVFGEGSRASRPLVLSSLRRPRKAVVGMSSKRSFWSLKSLVVKISMSVGEWRRSFTRRVKSMRWFDQYIDK